MIDYWLNQYTARGFVPGGMFVDGDVVYIPIPKNSSSYIGKLVLANNWKVANFLKTELTNKKIIVVLRDPINRWVSGMAQYLCSAIVSQGYTADTIINSWNPVMESLIFDRVIFDDHTEKQLYFINTVPKESCVYFNGVHGVGELLQKYLHEHDINLNIDIDINLEDNIQHQKLTKFLKTLLDQNTKLVDRLKEVYADDYKLINGVTFYD